MRYTVFFLSYRLLKKNDTGGFMFHIIFMKYLVIHYEQHKSFINTCDATVRLKLRNNDFTLPQSWIPHFQRSKSVMCWDWSTFEGGLLLKHIIPEGICDTPQNRFHSDGHCVTDLLIIRKQTTIKNKHVGNEGVLMLTFLFVMLTKTHLTFKCPFPSIL